MTVIPVSVLDDCVYNIVNQYDLSEIQVSFFLRNVLSFSNIWRSRTESHGDLHPASKNRASTASRQRFEWTWATLGKHAWCHLMSMWRKYALQCNLVHVLWPDLREDTAISWGNSPASSTASNITLGNINCIQLLVWTVSDDITLIGEAEYCIAK